jgi:hypothetical protein
LQVQQAQQGLQTSPHIITEIEDYQRNIATIEAELAELGEAITSA